MTKLASIVFSGVALTVTEVPALASSTTFAGYVQTNNNQDFVLTSTNLSGSNYSVNVTSSGQVSFNYMIGGTPFGGSAQLAALNLNVTSTFTGNCPTDANCATSGSTYTETGYSGSFSITLDTAFNGQSNLLSGTFNLLPSGNPNYLLSGGALASSVGLGTGALEATSTSSNPNQIVFTSDFLNFADTITRDAKFSLLALTPMFSVQGNTGAHNGFPFNFSAMGFGAFSDVEAPEPSMFALLACGLLAFCVWGRKRRPLRR
jgi:hypothetical protein